jgi:peptidoglycan hydrolase CwlO-like protein
VKQILALVTAFLVTSVIGLGMLAIGANAATNPNSVPVSDAPGDSSPAITAGDAQSQSGQSGDVVTQYQNRERQYQAQINQLNGLIAQYQSREKQYQTQLDQTNTQLQQLQQVLSELQRRGVIRVLSDGTIQLLGRRN